MDQPESVAMGSTDSTEPRNAADPLADDFLYLLTHDVRAGVRGIKSLTRWLQEDHRKQLDEAGNELVDMLDERASLLETLFEGLLEYSRIGRMQERRLPVDLAADIPALIERLRSAGNRIEVQGPLPTIDAEPRRLVQMFERLLLNAVHHAGEGNDSIVLRVVEQPAYWRFEVEDRGVGIPSSRFERIFLPLVSFSEDQRRVGMGLALCRKFIELHGGHIDVESEVGEGAKFVVSWPSST